MTEIHLMTAEHAYWKEIVRNDDSRYFFLCEGDRL